MRVIFFGTAAFAVPSLERLVAAGGTVALCVTQPDRPQGRGLKPQPSPVKQAAARLGLETAQPQRLDVQALGGVQADLGVAAAYGQLIRREVLALPARGVIGVHPSLLPKHRGAAPVAWALLNGETQTGVTIFQLDERLDAGPILSQRVVPIEPSHDAGTLTDHLAVLGAEELLKTLAQLEAGRITPRLQEESQATYAPKLTKAQGRIDWTQPASAIERLVRATVPWPGASTTWGGRPVKLWAVTIELGSGDAEPGTVAAVSPSGLLVETGHGRLLIRELQPAAGRRLSAREFLSGHRVKVGDRLGL